MNIDVLRKITTILSIMLVFAGNAAIAKDAFYLVTGRTNSGNQLGLNRKSVELDPDRGLYRYFEYYIITKDGDVRHNYGVTNWCRNGLVQLDKRTNINDGVMQADIYSQIVSTQQGGWMAINELRTMFVTADSPASQNLLKEVCKINAKRGVARGLFD